MIALGEHCQKEKYSKYFPEENPGYFETGDSGTMDSNGYLTIMSRTEDLVHLPTGEVIAPMEMEQLINQHPEVVDSVVVGFGNGLRGDMPVAFVVLREV